MDKIQELHEKILYPVCRVKAEKAGGSGVLIYSEEDSQRPGKYINIALTCEHVVDGCIKFVDDYFHPVLKKNVQMDILQEVSVEVFDYDGSRVISANSTQADIIAYDKRQDIAALRLHNPKKMPYVARIISTEEIENLKMFEDLWVSGCSLLHDPFASPGTLTCLRDIMEQKAYIMANAPSIFGNSGGGLFHDGGLCLIGLTTRVTGIQIGFGVDIMTWMEFSSHPSRLYEFFGDQELQFLYDRSDDYHKAMARREKRRLEALRELVLGREVPSPNEK